MCTGSPSSSGPSARRADHSLPQPLHLKAVFTDHNERKVSIRFEFVRNVNCHCISISQNRETLYSILVLVIKGNQTGIMVEESIRIALLTTWTTLQGVMLASIL